MLVPRSAIPMRSGLFMRTEKSIFHAIPWGSDHWLLGDTDTEWDGELDAPVANRADVDYLLAKVNSVLSSRSSRRRSAACSRAFARSWRRRGRPTRPGSRASTGCSRPLPGLTAIAGGKYTTYRVMARDAVDAASRDLGGSERRPRGRAECR